SACAYSASPAPSLPSPACGGGSGRGAPHPGLSSAVRPFPFRRGSPRANSLSPGGAGFKSLRRIGPPSALVQPAIENLLGDAVLENFGRAAGDHPAAAAAHAVFHQSVAAIARRPHGLHGLVRHLEPREVAGGLCERGFVGRRKAAIRASGSAVEQQL